MGRGSGKREEVGRMLYLFVDVCVYLNGWMDGWMDGFWLCGIAGSEGRGKKGQGRAGCTGGEVRGKR